MTTRKRWTTDEHKAVAMLRGLQDEISQLKSEGGDTDETQLFRDIVDTAVSSDAVSANAYDGTAALVICDDSTALGADFGEAK